VTGCGFKGAKQIGSLFLCDFERFFDELRVIRIFFFEYRRFSSLDSRDQRGQEANRLGYLLRRKSDSAGYEHHVQTSDAPFACPETSGRLVKREQSDCGQKRGEAAGNRYIGNLVRFSERPFHQPVKYRRRYARILSVI
jgi:hypothetical protein